MQSFLKLITLSMLVLLYFSSCTVEVSDIEDMETDEIKNQIAQGSIGEGMPFLTETALVEKTTLFDDPGYYFHLFDGEKECGDFLLGQVRFFVPTSTELSPGNYSGNGPFIQNTSFFGCDVVITAVSDSLIEGKVKGGDFEGDKNIEGIFSARLCD